MSSDSYNNSKRDMTPREARYFVSIVLFLIGMMLMSIAASQMFSVESCDLNAEVGCAFYKKVTGVIIENSSINYYTSKAGKMYYGNIKIQLLNSETNQTCKFKTKPHKDKIKAIKDVQRDYVLNSTAIVLQEKEHLSMCLRISEGLYSWVVSKDQMLVGAVMGGLGFIVVIALLLFDMCAMCERKVPTMAVVKWTDTVEPIQELAFVRVGVQDHEEIV